MVLLLLLSLFFPPSSTRFASLQVDQAMNPQLAVRPIDIERILVPPNANLSYFMCVTSPTFAAIRLHDTLWHHF